MRSSFVHLTHRAAGHTVQNLLLADVTWKATFAWFIDGHLKIERSGEGSGSGRADSGEESGSGRMQG